MTLFQWIAYVFLTLTVTTVNMLIYKIVLAFLYNKEAQALLSRFLFGFRGFNAFVIKDLKTLYLLIVIVVTLYLFVFFTSLDTILSTQALLNAPPTKPIDFNTSRILFEKIPLLS